MDNKALTVQAQQESTPNKGGRPKGAKDLKPRKRRTDLTVEENPNLKPGDTSRYLAHNMEVSALLPIDCNKREQVEQRINEYFKLCIKHDIRPGVAGLCLALGIDRVTWYTWGAGTRRNGEYMDIVARSRQIMESLLESYAMHNQINPAIFCFELKNHFGYRDQSEVVLTPNTNPLGDEPNMEALKRKYLESAGIVEDVDYMEGLPDGETIDP